jgi:hypothetical protein
MCENKKECCGNCSCESSDETYNENRTCNCSTTCTSLPNWVRDEVYVDPLGATSTVYGCWSPEPMPLGSWPESGSSLGFSGQEDLKLIRSEKEIRKALIRALLNYAKKGEDNKLIEDILGSEYTPKDLQTLIDTLLWVLREN